MSKKKFFAINAQFVIKFNCSVYLMESSFVKGILKRLAERHF